MLASQEPEKTNCGCELPGSCQLSAANPPVQELLDNEVECARVSIRQHAGHVGVVARQLSVFKHPIEEDIAQHSARGITGHELADTRLWRKHGRAVDEPHLVCGVQSGGTYSTDSGTPQRYKQGQSRGIFVFFAHKCFYGSRLAGHKATYVGQCKLTHWRHRKTIDEWSGVYYGRPSSHARVACTLKTPHRDAQYETKLHCWQLAQLLSPPHRIKHHTIINSPYVS